MKCNLVYEMMKPAGHAGLGREPHGGDHVGVVAEVLVLVWWPDQVRPRSSFVAVSDQANTNSNST